MLLVGILDVIKEYLNERKQLVTLGDCESGCLSMDIGVPQGTILEPLLFKIYINDMFDIEIDDSELFSYAYDTVALNHDQSWTKEQAKNPKFHNSYIFLPFIEYNCSSPRMRNRLAFYVPYFSTNYYGNYPLITCMNSINSICDMDNIFLPSL